MDDSPLSNSKAHDRDSPKPPTFSSPFRVQRSRLGDEIERYLCDAILSGRYVQGERLSPTALAKEFDVSAMPVREALVALHTVGLVDTVARRGFRVASISWRDVEDAFAAQAFISGRLAEYAAAVASPVDIARLRSLQREIEAAAGAEDAAARIEELNNEFHRTINRLSDAKHLRRFLRVVSGVIPRQLHALVPGWIDATIGDHPRLIDALERHDDEAARELTEAHVRAAGALVVGKLKASSKTDGPTVAPPRSAG